jgi:hypothetical protein
MSSRETPNWKTIRGADFLGAVAPRDRPDQLATVYVTLHRANAHRLAATQGGQAIGRLLIIAQPPSAALEVKRTAGRCLNRGF